MKVSYRELVERRVPQYLAVYLGAGWGLIEFTSFLEERYALSPHWTDLLLLAWALLIPSVVLYTWHHGRPGRDNWARSEKVFIPLNIVIVVAVLGIVFGGRDLRAATTTVTVEDESGTAIERKVVRSAYRKRIAVFYFDSPQNDTASAWLRIAVPFALAMDLSQDPFVDLRMPVNFREQLTAKGFAEGLDVPLALMRDIAAEVHQPHFIAGSVTGEANGYTINMELYETESGRLLQRQSLMNNDLLAAVDQLTVIVRDKLGLPSTASTGSVDLPVSELLSENLQAIRDFAQSLTYLWDGDWAATDAALAQATTHDPTFAIAHLMHYQTRAMRGDGQGGMPALEKAMQHIYRMPERMQFIVKVEHYLLNRDVEKARKVAMMMVELYPDDLQGLQYAAQLEIFRNERKSAINFLHRVLQLDPQQQEVLLQIGELQEQDGQTDAALATFQEYVNKFPRDVPGQRRVGRLLLRLGKQAEAREVYDRASMIDPTHVGAQVDLAGLELGAGEFDRALNRFQDALRMARNAEDSARALGGLESYYEYRGEVRQALVAVEQSLRVETRFRPPVQVLSRRMSVVDNYLLAGQRAQAEAMLQQVKSQVTAPLDELWHLGQLTLAQELRDTVRLKESMAGVRSLIEGLGFGFLEPLMAQADGVLNEVRGDWQAALAAYDRQQSLDPTITRVRRDRGRALRNLGRHHEALQVIESALAVSPFSPPSNIEAARVKLQLNDVAGAREHLERAARTLSTADAGHPLLAELKELQAQTGG